VSPNLNQLDQKDVSFFSPKLPKLSQRQSDFQLKTVNKDPQSFISPVKFMT